MPVNEGLVQIKIFSEFITKNLSDKLRRPKYRGSPLKVAGHCYVASEAMYHLLKEYGNAEYHPYQLKWHGDSHWFLARFPRYPDAFKGLPLIIDLTAEQLDPGFPYEDARRRGFLTKYPSRRAEIVIRKVKQQLFGHQ